VFISAQLLPEKPFEVDYYAGRAFRLHMYQAKRMNNTGYNV
jgi:hypothetical protein